MSTIISERFRREWFIIFIIMLIGVCLMLVVGQRAITLAEYWSLSANMDSNLDPNSKINPELRVNGVQPVNLEILDFPAWNDTYLTPTGKDADPEAAATMVDFDSNVTPSATPTPSTSPSPSPSPTGSVTPEPSPSVTETPSPTPTPVVTATKKKKKERDDDPPPPPPPSPVTSTPEGVQVAPPANLNVGSPDVNTANISSGDYVVIDISGNPIVVEGPSETNYDLVYYEWDNGGNVLLDDVVVGISQQPNGNPYYEVFNWGDGTPDTNTNVDVSATHPTDPSAIPPDPSCAAEPECDNRIIPTSELHDPASPPAEPQSGILIDVDNASSNPPAGVYDYTVIVSPATGADPAQVDSIEVVEVTP